MNGFSLRKEVDKSVLLQGLSIPLRNQFLLQQQMPVPLNRGEHRSITLILEGRSYPALLVNQRFNETRYAGHGNIVQVRYEPASAIASQLRLIFSATYEFLQQQGAFDKDRPKRRYPIPDDQKEYLDFVMTDQPDVYLVECIPLQQKNLALNYYSTLDEEAFEKNSALILKDGFADLTDDEAGIRLKRGILRIRDYDRSIGDRLKAYYGYRCQICGSNFGEPHDAHIVEAHHIDPFTRSLNNNYDNQIIICPNHHRIIHVAKPRFDRPHTRFIYGNGFIEPVTLNDHLT